MTAITTSTASTATAYSNQRKIDRTSNGVLWAHYWSGSNASPMRFAYSLDNGQSWVDNVANAFEFSGAMGGTYIPNSSFFIDQDDYAHVAYKDRVNGYVYYRRGTPNAARTAWTWSDSGLIRNSTNANYPDVVAHREGTGWVAHIVSGFAGGATNYTEYNTVSITSTGVVTVGSNLIIGGNYAVFGVGHTYPSIDFNHTGDGKTVAGGTPHLYVGWSAGATGAGKGIRFRKATYAAGSWTWGTEREIANNVYVSGVATWLNCIFDGTRVIIAGALTFNGSDVYLRAWDRDAADTTTTAQVSLTSTTTDMQLLGSATYDGGGNVYLFGRNADEAAGTFDLVYRKWTRGGAALGSEVVIDSGVGASPHVSARRGYSNQRIEWVYTDGTSSPYTVTYDAISLFTPATMKVWSGSAWAEKPIKRWDGSAWVAVEASKFKYHNGTDWVAAS